MRTGILLSFLLIIQLAGRLPAQGPALHTMFLERPLPAPGTAVEFNAPILRWPYQKGKGVTYEVRLSQDARFPASSTLSATGLTGAFFNPHRSLDTGTWFWQYRVSGKTWSSVLDFTVPPDALEMVSPPAAAFLASLPAEHPRILPNHPGQDLSGLSRHPEATAILAGARQALSQQLFTEKDAAPLAEGATPGQQQKIAQDAVVFLGKNVQELVLSSCQAYLLTHDQRYADKAKAMAMEVASWDPNGISGSADFTDGACMYSMALVFDTFYDQLPPKDRRLLLTAIKSRASGFYHHWVNSIESKVLSGHVWQLLLNSFFKTAIALYHHEPEAQQWLTYAYELFLARAPVLGGLDGGWAEGASYFWMNMETLIEIPAKIKSYSGFDFIAAHPWYRNQANGLIYHVPPGSSADGFGDNTEELFAPLPAHAAFAATMAGLTQDPGYHWYAATVRELHDPDLAREPVLRWFRLVNSAPLPSPAGPIRLPMGNLSREVGVAALHTHPTQPAENLMVTMRASPFGSYGHQLADQNTFNILLGGQRVFYRTGYKVAMNDPHRLGWSKHTKSHNGILVNGHGQPYSAEAYGYFSRFLSGESIAYMKGDASAAYQSAETGENHGVQKFLRHIVLLKPDLVVIYDELEAAAASEWSWLLHSLDSMQLDTANHRFATTVSTGHGTGRLWSSTPLKWQLTDKFEVPVKGFRNYPGMRHKKYEDNQWHLKATSRAPVKSTRFLAVMQVSKDSVPLFTEATRLAGITELTVGDWKISAALDPAALPGLEIRSRSGKAAFTAYNPDFEFQGRHYKGVAPQSSKLAELVNGRIIFTETADEPPPAIR